MGCVRKRGKSWNAQVRIAGWRSFTKSFKTKSDAVCWVQQTEHQLKNTSLPLVDVGDTTLKRTSPNLCQRSVITSVLDYPKSSKIIKIKT